MHFGLPEAVYHADGALGSGDLRTIAQSPAEYWWHSARNPLRPIDAETPALLWGRAFHALVLEGPDRFRARYRRRPQRTDHPDVPATIPEMREALGGKGMSGKSRDDLIALCRTAEIETFADVEKDFADEIATSGATALDAATFDGVVSAASAIVINPTIRATFQNGLPEVTVVWIEDGVRCKARIDWLKATGFADLKSFRPTGYGAIERAVSAAIGVHRYDMQMAHLHRAREAIVDHLSAGRVFGRQPASVWLDRLAREVDVTGWLIFYKAEGAPIVIARRFSRRSQVVEAGEIERQRALALYRDNDREWGSAMWPHVDAMTDPEVTWDDLPRWMSAGA